MSGTMVVVPCFNEARRLDSRRFLEQPGEEVFLFVDDGSDDGTDAVLEELCARAPERLRWLRLPENAGKGEAVRRGLLQAFESGPDFAGWLDADLAAPPETVALLRGVLEAHPEADLALGARALLLGRTIERSAVRHYLGRIFATCASLLLEMPVYDTQCGAKLLRVKPETRALFERPFTTRWLFDIEMLLRFTRPDGRLDPERVARVREEPLPVWRDVPGSKVGPLAFGRAAWDLARLWLRYR